jgi:molybdopterin molybdotransferase
LTVATTQTSLRSMPGKQQLVRARAEISADGVRVTPVGGAGSHLIAGLAQADALIVLAEGVTRVDMGDQVPVLLLDRPLS